MGVEHNLDTKGSEKLERQDSAVSMLSMGKEACRICHCDSSCGELISPCYCSGTLLWVHQDCLQHWIRASNHKTCELCHYPFSVRTKLKPPCGWEALPMSSAEKRRFICSAIFHSIALGCVMWSLYVLIDRTIDEIHHKELEWQFWTKIVVEAIGCLGAGILIYVWGKSYVSLIVKWITFNRTFMIVSSNPKVRRPPSSPPSPSLNLCQTHLTTSRVGTNNIVNVTNNGVVTAEVSCSSPQTGGSGDAPCDKSHRDAMALLLPSPVGYNLSLDPQESVQNPHITVRVDDS